MKDIKAYIEDYMNDRTNHISNDAKTYIRILHSYENLYVTLNESLVFEGSGIYAGCYDLAKYINEKIFSSEDSNISIITHDLNMKNIFTHRINININRNGTQDNAWYVFGNNEGYEMSRWDNISNMFNWIDIKVEICPDTKSVISLIIHELTHAQDDWQQHKHNGKTYTYKYIESNYDAFTVSEKDDNFTKLVKIINYVCSDFEVKSYIAQMNDEIDKKFSNIYDAYDYFDKHSNTWKQFKIVENNIEIILQNKEYSTKYCDVYRKIFNNKYSDKKILNMLRKSSRKMWRKTINHVYHILSNNLNENRTYHTIPSSNKLNDIPIIQ